ncbi:MAG: 50S ribosomal protein L4 [Thermoplasmata archaeon]
MIKLKCNVYSNDGKVTGEIDLPGLFEEPVRKDLIRRAFRAISLSKRQPYGSSPFAGMRRVGQNVGANHGISRLPRVAGGSRGVILASMVGGRSAHSPRSNKNLYVKVNKKERVLARRSALSSTASRELVNSRGHSVPQDLTLPVVVDNSVDMIKKTKDALVFLETIGIGGEITRVKEGKKVRAGRGKMRGRRYKKPVGILLVESKEEDLSAFKGLPGVEVSKVSALSISKLAPGGNPGRLTIFTRSAINSIEEVKK